MESVPAPLLDAPLEAEEIRRELDIHLDAGHLALRLVGEILLHLDEFAVVHIG